MGMITCTPSKNWMALCIKPYRNPAPKTSAAVPVWPKIITTLRGISKAVLVICGSKFQLLVSAQSMCGLGWQRRKRQLEKTGKLTQVGDSYSRHAHWARGPVGAWGWMVPAIVGGVVVYEAARQQPPIMVQPQTSSLTPQNLQNCSPWTEVQNPNGTTTRTRT